jgi:outer membrane protein assembly factor BamB
MEENGVHAETQLYSSNIEEKRLQRQKRRRKIRLSVIGIICLLIAFLAVYQFTDIIIGITEELTSNSYGNDWAMFGRNLARTASTGPSGKLPQGKLKWSFITGDHIQSSPAVSDGTVYIGSNDGYVYAIDAETGQEKWKYKTGSWVESSPVIVDGVVYVGSNDSKLYALDAETGKKIWDYKATYAIRSGPAVSNGKVYFGADDYSMYAVDTETGNKVWSYETDNYVQSSPVVSGGIVYFGSFDGFLYALNANNGGLRLKFDTRSAIVDSPVISDTIVYCLNSKGWLYAIDGGAKNWLFENKIKQYWNALYIYGVMPKPPDPSGYIWAEWLEGNSGSSTTYSDGKIYAGLDNRIVSVDTQNQTVLWEYSTGGRVASSPAIEDGVVYFGSGDGNLYAVNAADGVELWEAATGDEIISSPAIADGVVYIGSNDGNLYAYE